MPEFPLLKNQIRHIEWNGGSSHYARTVPNVDIVGSIKCHTRHLATGGVAPVSTKSWVLTQALS